MKKSFLTLKSSKTKCKKNILGDLRLNILAISTTSTMGSIAIFKENKIAFINHSDVKVTHSERLLPQIDFGLQNCNLQISEVDAVAIANGPGSFTGIRIGLATAKGICVANKIPLIPFNTLELLAHNLTGTKRSILSIIDAKMGEIYAALYSNEHKEIIVPQNAKPAEFLHKIEEPVIIIGDGVEKYFTEIMDSGIDFQVAFQHQNIPLASTMISIILKNAVPEYDSEIISNLEPYYLRKSQAEIAKEEGVK